MTRFEIWKRTPKRNTSGKSFDYQILTFIDHNSQCPGFHGDIPTMRHSSNHASLGNMGVKLLVFDTGHDNLQFEELDRPRANWTSDSILCNSGHANNIPTSTFNCWYVEADYAFSHLSVQITQSVRIFSAKIPEPSSSALIQAVYPRWPTLPVQIIAKKVFRRIYLCPSEEESPSFSKKAGLFCTPKKASHPGINQSPSFKIFLFLLQNLTSSSVGLFLTVPSTCRLFLPCYRANLRRRTSQK